MNPDQRITKLARVLIRYSLAIKEGEKVFISGSTASEPLLRELFKEVLRAGAHPRLNIGFEDQQYLFYSMAKDFQLEYIDPILIYEMEHIDAAIRLMPNLNPFQLTAIEPGKKQKIALTQKPIVDIFMKRMAERYLPMANSFIRMVRF